MFEWYVYVVYVYIGYEGTFDCMMKLLLALAYPFLLVALYGVLLSSRWSSILLMEADARGNRGQQGRDKFAA